MSEFLAENNDAMNQTMTIRTKMNEERKQKGLDATSKSIITDISRSRSRPITPHKSNSKIPFIDETYMKSPMRTRNKIPRTPFNDAGSDTANDFQRDDQSFLSASITPSQIPSPPDFGKQKTSVAKPAAKVTAAVNQTPIPAQAAVERKAPEAVPETAFKSKDLIPRTPPQAKAVKHTGGPEEKKKKIKK